MRCASPSSMLAATQPAGHGGKWSPAATFFHFATKNVAWASGEALQELEDTLRARAAIEPPPPAMKTDRRAAVPLPRAAAEGEFRSVLLERRTWRGFAPGRFRSPRSRSCSI